MSKLIFRKIKRSYYNLQRYKQIVTVLIKYGFGRLVEELNLKHYLPFIIPKEKTEKMSRSQRIRMAFEELGPTFIKLGQILSTRPDIISTELMEELIKLQDNVPSFSFNKAKAIIEEELLQSVEEIFIEIEERPIASASIAQVHHAVLKNGDQVIIKVQRPQIKENIESDIDILKNLANLIERRFHEMANYNISGIIDEFAISIRKELDFNIEAYNIEKFRKNMSKDGNLYIPRLYKEYVTKKIIVLEEIRGVKINDIKGIEENNLDKKQIALNGANIILKQIFIDGFFHGDPHPGNIFVLEENKLCFLDFGIIGRLDDDTRSLICDLIISLYQKNASKIIKMLDDLSLIREKINRSRLKIDISDLIDYYYDVSIREVNFKKLAEEIFRLIQQYKISIPQSLIMLIKVLVTLEGIGKTLYSEFNVTQEIRPFVEELLKQQSIYLNQLKKFTASVDKLIMIPEKVEELLRKTTQDELKLTFVHKGLENLLCEIDRVSNRISFSVIIAALIVGSSLILQTSKGPLILGIPLLGIVGFLIAAILGLGLVISILRSGKF